MGLHFGELAKIRGLIYYKLSQHEQKPFAGAIRYGIPNFVTRYRASWLKMVPTFIISYMVYEWAESTHHHASRKNLNDYLNEVDPEAVSD